MFRLIESTLRIVDEQNIADWRLETIVFVTYINLLFRFYGTRYPLSKLFYYSTLPYSSFMIKLLFQLKAILCFPLYLYILYIHLYIYMIIHYTHFKYFSQLDIESISSHRVIIRPSVRLLIRSFVFSFPFLVNFLHINTCSSVH